MKLSYKLLILITFFSLPSAFAQLELSHEFGVTTGPVTMQTDYGERHHLPSSTATSFGVAAVHYLSFYGSNYNWRLWRCTSRIIRIQIFPEKKRLNLSSKISGLLVINY